jgi:hypothetical protein
MRRLCVKGPQSGFSVTQASDSTALSLFSRKPPHGLPCLSIAAGDARFELFYEYPGLKSYQSLLTPTSPWRPNLERGRIPSRSWNSTRKSSIYIILYSPSRRTYAQHGHPSPSELTPQNILYAVFFVPMAVRFAVLRAVYQSGPLPRQRASPPASPCSGSLNPLHLAISTPASSFLWLTASPPVGQYTKQSSWSATSTACVAVSLPA